MPRIFRQIFFWLLIIITVFIRYQSSSPGYQKGDLIKITTTVYSDPLKYKTSQLITVLGLKVFLPISPEISYGEKISLTGIVGDGTLENPKLLSVESPGIFPVIRNRIVDFYQKTLPQPMSGLIGGIVLGAKGGIDKDFYDMTKSTGVAHVVVASGTNVTFVVSAVSSILFVFLPRRKAIPFIFVGIILYLFISGFEAPLIRAAVMSFSAFLTQSLGRVSSTWRIFFLTCAGMLIYNPEWVTDIGFILSFVSTGSILLFQKTISKFLKKIPVFFKEDFATTLSAQVGVTPILFVTFGQFNIWSPLINMLVLWTIPPLMVIGSVAALVGITWEPAGRVILYLGYPLLWWFTKAVTFFS